MPDPQVWPAAANLKEEVVEPYGYLTDVMTAENGDEQRVGLRRHPLNGYEFTYLCRQVNDGQHVASLLYENRTKPWVVPLWMHARQLGAPVGLGATVITVDTVNAPFKNPMGLGLYAVLWAGTRTYEAVQLDVVSASSISLLAPTTRSWAVSGTWVIPARVGYLGESVREDWHTGALEGGRIRFSFNAVKEALAAAAAAAGTVVFGELDEPV